MKYNSVNIKKAVISTLLVVSLLISICSLSVCAMTWDAGGHTCTVGSNETNNGYTLKLSWVNGSSVGALWRVSNGGPASLNCKCTIVYVDKNGSTKTYYGFYNYLPSSVDSKSLTRSISTSRLSSYARLAKVEAKAKASCFSGEAFINAYN